MVSALTFPGDTRESHMLIPAGIPEPIDIVRNSPYTLQFIYIPQKVRTSSDVKSGDRNSSFSNSLDQGNKGIRDGASRTSSPNARVRSTTQEEN